MRSYLASLSRSLKSHLTYPLQFLMSRRKTSVALQVNLKAELLPSLVLQWQCF
jgi:hypothetical protein